MFGTIRRHQSWLLFVIMGATIVSFLVWMDPSQRGSRRGRGERGDGGIGTIGEHVITPREFDEARRDFRLLYFLNTRKWPEEDRERSAQIDEDREAALRLITIVKAQEAGIQVSDQSVAELASRILGGPNGMRLDQFATEVLRRGNLTADDFERFVRHELMRQQLTAVTAAAGRMVTPAEAEEEYRREHQEVAGEAVLFTVSNYLSRVAVSNEVLTMWYSNRMAQYRTPELVRVSYVEFSRTNFLAEADKQIESVTNLNLQLEQVYQKAGTNSFKDTNGVVLPHDKAIAQIKEGERDKLSMFYARKKANEFGNKLVDLATKDNATAKASALEEAAKSEKLNVQVTPPFDMQDGPTNLTVGPEFTRAAFALNPTNNPIAFQPLAGEDAYYILAYKDSTPSRVQSFAEVKQKVADDYRHMQAFMMAREEGMAFQAKATNAVAQGKSFTDVAAQSNLKAITLPPISPRSESVTNLPGGLNIRQVRSVLLSLDPGKVSGFIPNPPEGGYVMHVKQKLPIDEAKLKTELPKFMAEMRFSRQNEIFNNWFRKQVEKAAPGLPMLNKPAQRGGRG